MIWYDQTSEADRLCSHSIERRPLKSSITQNSDADQTLLDHYANEAAGKSRNELLNDWGLAPLAAHHLLVKDDQGYRSLLTEAAEQQIESYRQRNSHYQMRMGYGMNYNDKLYVGISASLGLLRHRRTRDYQESYPQRIDNLSVIDNLNSRGSSVEMGLGLIYRPISPLRIGLSIESPTIYNINEQTSYDWTTYFDNYEHINENNETKALTELRYESDLLKTNYGLLTPYRLHAGASYFWSNQGFISGQVSFTDYKSMYIFSDDFNTTYTNKRIEEAYSTALNYYLGGELHLARAFYLRAGYSYRNPMLAHREATQHYALGGGYQRDILDISLALERVDGEETYQPFQSAQMGRLKTQALFFLFTTTFFIYN